MSVVLSYTLNLHLPLSLTLKITSTITITATATATATVTSTFTPYVSPTFSLACMCGLNPSIFACLHKQSCVPHSPSATSLSYNSDRLCLPCPSNLVCFWPLQEKLGPNPTTSGEINTAIVGYTDALAASLQLLGPAVLYAHKHGAEGDRMVPLGGGGCPLRADGSPREEVLCVIRLSTSLVPSPPETATRHVSTAGLFAADAAVCCC
jgi:hypothetical protein